MRPRQRRAKPRLILDKIHRTRKDATAWIRAFMAGIVFFLVSIFVGIIAFNYVALPVWVGRYEEIAVPDVCGKKLEEAKLIIADYGLKVRIEAQKFSNVPEGIVVSQHPLPTRRVKKGREISLCVSRGQEKIKVPWVQGLELTQAEELIKSQGLNVKEVIYEYSEELLNNEVIRTDPSADTPILYNAGVTIYVSQGLTDFRIPDFMWKTLSEVQSEANRMGLSLETQYVADPSPNGVIIAQHPLPGTPAKSGEKLKVIIGVAR